MPVRPCRGLVAAVALPLAGCVTTVPPPGPDPYAPLAIEHGRITGVEPAQRPSSAPAGAVFGGILGLLLSGPSAGEKLAGMAVGATAGGVLTAASEGPTQGWVFTVQFPDGRLVRVMTEQADLRVGDCVAVETGRWVNLRRVSGAFCDAAPLPPDGWEQRARDDAARCQAAKDELVGAQGREQVDAAVRKVRVLCGT